MFAADTNQTGENLLIDGALATLPVLYRQDALTQIVKSNPVRLVQFDPL